MSNNEQQQITCAYGFDNLSPEQKHLFQDFIEGKLCRYCGKKKVEHVGVSFACHGGMATFWKPYIPRAEGCK